MFHSRRACWRAVLIVALLPLLITLTRELWEQPFPISKTVAVMADAGVLSHSATDPHSLRDPKLLSFFDPATRSQFRPLYWTPWYTFWHATHSLDQTLPLFRVLELVSVLGLVTIFLWLLDVRPLLDVAAALAATTVLIGSPGFRDNLEFPLLMTLIGMPLALLVWTLLQRPHRPWHIPLVALAIGIAVGFKE